MGPPVRPNCAANSLKDICQVFVGVVLEDSVGQVNFRRILFPDLTGAVDHLGLDFLGALIGSPAGGERRAAAAGQEGVAHRVGVAHLGAHGLRPGMPSTSAACMAMDAREPPMSVEPSTRPMVPSAFTLMLALDRQPDVHPVTAGDAAPPVGAGQLGFVVVRSPWPLPGFRRCR